MFPVTYKVLSVQYGEFTPEGEKVSKPFASIRALASESESRDGYFGVAVAKLNLDVESNNSLAKKIEEKLKEAKQLPLEITLITKHRFLSNQQVQTTISDLA